MIRQHIVAAGAVVLAIGTIASFMLPQLALLPAVIFILALLLILFIEYPLQTLLGVLGLRVLLDQYSDYGLTLAGFDLNLSAVLVLVIIVIVPVYMIVKRPVKIPWFSMGPFLAFILLGIVSVFYGSFPQEALADAARLLSYGAILYLASAIVSAEKYKTFLSVFPFILIIPAIFAIQQLLSGVGHYDFGVLKPVGTFFHPNYLGYGSLIVLVVLIINIVYKHRQKKTDSKVSLIFQYHLLFIFAALLLFFIFKVQSLGVILALLIILVFYLLRLAGQSLVLIVGTIGLCLAIFFPWYNYELGRQGTAVVDNPVLLSVIGESEADGSFLWRIRNWQSMFGFVAERPWLGWGLGSYKPLRAEQAEYETDLLALEAHNDYMNFVIEIGFVGAGFLIISLYGFVLIILRNSKRVVGFAPLEPDFRVSSFFIGSLLLAIMITMSVENIFKGAAIMWPLLALVGATIRQTCVSKELFHKI